MIHKLLIKMEKLPDSTHIFRMMSYEEVTGRLVFETTVDLIDKPIPVRRSLEKHMEFITSQFREFSLFPVNPVTLQIDTDSSKPLDCILFLHCKFLRHV